MIAKLKGLVEGQEDSAALIDVNGVVYRALCSSRTLGALPAKGQPTVLETEYLVIQDVPTLIGFGTLAELEAFRSAGHGQRRGSKGGSGDPVGPRARYAVRRNCQW